MPSSSCQELQFGVPGFFPNWRDPIDGPYFDGVAVMHGSPRQHIWTFAIGHFKNDSSPANCPCDLTYRQRPIPSYVGNDCFCESGIVNGPNVLFTQMTLSGMERTVTPPVHVALFTTRHTSPKPSMKLLMMT